jgi:hypothetical protein
MWMPTRSLPLTFRIPRHDHRQSQSRRRRDERRVKAGAGEAVSDQCNVKGIASHDGILASACRAPQTCRSPASGKLTARSKIENERRQ